MLEKLICVNAVDSLHGTVHAAPKGHCGASLAEVDLHENGAEMSATNRCDPAKDQVSASNAAKITFF